jgi:hypothetical protein
VSTLANSAARADSDIQNLRDAKMGKILLKRSIAPRLGGHDPARQQVGVSDMNRITLTLDNKGDIIKICSDEPVELYWIEPNARHDQVFLHGAVKIGAKFVEGELKKHPISHLDDELCGKLPAGMPPGCAYHVVKTLKCVLKQL